MTLFSCFLGPLLLLSLLSPANGLAPNIARSVNVKSNINVPSKSVSALRNAGAVNVPIFEDKPHLMIGGRGYHKSNLFVDPAEFDDALEAMAKRQRRRALKYIAGYTAIFCGSLCLRQFAQVLYYLPYYYKAFPLPAAMATCGIKSMVADFLSQIHSWNGRLDWKRSASGLTYGAAILGAGSKLAYTQVLPQICGPGLVGTALQCALDNFVLAPLIWIPGAYVVKGLFFNVPLKQALANYVADIKEEKLLNNYWKLWVPAQLLNFSIMPQHLRVPFVAGVGFCWFLFLSHLTYKKQEEQLLRES